MSEAITVAVRVRPLNETEMNNNDDCIWSIDPIMQNTISLSPSCLCDFMEEGKLNGLAAAKFRFSNYFNKY